jgi:antitoxin component YwqK of YwqJK toxin-antitoxin module
MGSNDPMPLFPDAIEVLEDGGEPLGSRWRCTLGGRVVGYRHRHPGGALAMEYEVDAEGRRHGHFREWHDDGAPSFETLYVHGVEDGVARQYDRDGRLIGTYELRLGTGVDLWRDEDGRLSEERHLRDGKRHGVERWWTGDDRTIREESHFRADVEHGIHRQWNDSGRLRRGYPRYYVNGERVTKRRYLAASKSDPTLPPYREADDRPERPLPSEYARHTQQER